MAPILFTVGPYNAYSFGLFLALAFLFSTFVVWKYAKKELKEEEYLDAYFFTCIVALITSRGLYILKNLNQFGTNILKYFVVRETPGLSLVGAIVGGVIFLLFYSKKRRIDFLHFGDILTIAGASALFFAKIGEQLGGAAFGKKTDLFIGLKIVGLPGKYLPVEIIEALSFFLLTIILIWTYSTVQKRNWPKGLVLYLFIELSSVIIFLVEFMKVSSVYLYNLSLRQVSALIIFILILLPIIYTVRQYQQKRLNLKDI